jgi:Kef-type K+ transport system membrane component KefB
MHETIRDITYCILSAWGLGLLAYFSRQPLILAYLIAGFFIGPFGMGWVKSQESISVISELGLIFMLFMIGLEIDLKKIIRAGRVILFAALGQLAGGCVLGILFFVGIGFSIGGGHSDVLYLCVACALSSTVIIVKVLYESASSIRRPDASLSTSWCFRISLPPCSWRCSQVSIICRSASSCCRSAGSVFWWRLRSR